MRRVIVGISMLSGLWLFARPTPQSAGQQTGTEQKKKTEKKKTGGADKPGDLGRSSSLSSSSQKAAGRGPANEAVAHGAKKTGSVGRQGNPAFTVPKPKEKKIGGGDKPGEPGRTIASAPKKPGTRVPVASAHAKVSAEKLGHTEPASAKKVPAAKAQ